MPILLTLLLYFIASVFLGLALVPAVWFVYLVMGWVGTMEGWLRGLMICWSVAAGFFIFGLSLIFEVGLVRACLTWRLKEGTYSVRSVTAFKWFFVNALQTLVCNVFGGFLILTPFMNLLYRLMGARLGRDVLINSEFCADLPILEIGDGSVIGGHATVIGHSLEGGQLILKPLKIGKNVVIGLNAVVLPGCVIADGAVIAAGAVLPKDTWVEANTTYAGVPARRQEGGGH